MSPSFCEKSQYHSVSLLVRVTCVSITSCEEDDVNLGASCIKTPAAACVKQNRGFIKKSPAYS